MFLPARLLTVALSALLLVSTAHSQGAIIVMELSEVFPGKDSPDGTAPWLTATFEDVAGGVQLTLRSFLAPGNKVQGNQNQLGWTFNIRKELESSLGQLDISFLSGDSDPGKWKISANAFKADGIGGKFDIMFYWKKDAKALKGTKTLTYKLSGISGLNVFDFDAYSESKTHGDTIYKSAAKIQGISSGEGSTHIGASSLTVAPEPAAWLTWAGLLGVGLCLCRRRFRQ